MSFRERGYLALLLLPYRPLRVCSVAAPSHLAFLAKTGAILFSKHALRLCGFNFYSVLLRFTPFYSVWSGLVGVASLLHHFGISNLALEWLFMTSDDFS
jgi:hypothetical protein